MATMGTISYALIIIGSIVLGLYPYVLSATPTTPADMDFAYLLIRKKEIKIITAKHYWFIGWMFVIGGTVLQAYMFLMK